MMLMKVIIAIIPAASPIYATPVHLLSVYHPSSLMILIRRRSALHLMELYPMEEALIIKQVTLFCWIMVADFSAEISDCN